ALARRPPASDAPLLSALVPVPEPLLEAAAEVTPAPAAGEGPALGRGLAQPGKLVALQVVLVAEVLDDEGELCPPVVEAHARPGWAGWGRRARLAPLLGAGNRGKDLTANSAGRRRARPRFSGRGVGCLAPSEKRRPQRFSEGAKRDEPTAPCFSAPAAPPGRPP